MKNKDGLDELRKLLIGKTIDTIFRSENDRECIGIFRTTDGHQFKLFATDLGFWIEETSLADGTYNSLTALCCDYYNYLVANNIYDQELEIELINTKIIVAAPGRDFIGNVDHFNEFDKKVSLSVPGRDILKSAVILGSMWQSMFSKRNNVPADLEYDA